MSIQIVHGDITCCDCDAIVNAANGIGFMGGIIGRIWKCAGVSETIHYETKGKVERDVRLKCLRRFPIGYLPGSVFSTKGYNLKCRHIIHAVTMWLPGTFSSLKTVERLLPKVLAQARSLHVKRLALPLLGTGVGRLNPDRVLKLYHAAFDDVQDMEIHVYIYRKDAK